MNEQTLKKIAEELVKINRNLEAMTKAISRTKAQLCFTELSEAVVNIGSEGEQKESEK